MGSASTRYVHGVVFDDPDVTVAAVRALREKGYVLDDVHTPFPVHGMPKAMGLKDTRLAYGSLIGGTIGLSLAVWFQIWSHASDWPLVVGGKTMSAIPAIIPVSFEATVLLAGIATVGTLLAACRLFPRAKEPPTLPHSRVTSDRFVVLVAEEDGSFLRSEFQALCKELGSVEILESWRTT